VGLEKCKGTGRCECICFLNVQAPAQARVASTHIVTGGVVLGACLDAIGQETEDSPDPQQDGEAPKELTAELDPLRSRGRRRECIRTIPGQNLLGFAVCQTLGDTALTQNPLQQPCHPNPSPASQAKKGTRPQPPPSDLGVQAPALLGWSHLHTVRVVLPADLLH
jgi:hypothetical protein